MNEILNHPEEVLLVFEFKFSLVAIQLKHDGNHPFSVRERMSCRSAVLKPKTSEREIQSPCDVPHHTSVRLPPDESSPVWQ